MPGLPPDLRFHDLQHHIASLLNTSGAGVKVVQARLQHASASTTPDTYGHLWPDSDERTVAAIDAGLAARAKRRDATRHQRRESADGDVGGPSC